MTNLLESDNKYYNHFLAKMFNRMIMSVIVILISVTLSMGLRAYLGLSTITTFIIIVLISILLSPFLSKINLKVGYVIEEEYFKFLDKMTKKWIYKK